MAYNKVHPDGWHNAPNNTTPITADAMNTIEQGVYDNSQQLGTLAPRNSLPETITYNADGTVHTVTETDSGAVTTYAYNSDGTVHTESRLLGGNTVVRTFAYSNGNIVGIA